MAQEQDLTADEQVIWTTQARVNDPAAIENLLMFLPVAVAVQARKLARLPGQNGMEYDPQLKCAYWLTHQSDGVFVCVTFGYVPDLKGATKLWEVLSDENHEPSIERLLSVYKQATGIEIAALPLH